MESSHPSQKSKALKRIMRDLNEIASSPIEGLGISMPDENEPFHLRANILILDGIYKGIILHMRMTIPETYPIKSPKMLIVAGQGFTNQYHHHVFESAEGSTICIDLLDHGFFSDGQKTGWTPAYTLSTILMQMQIFFSKDYDLHELPSQNDIDRLREKVATFKERIRLTDGSTIDHTFQKPYPEICSKSMGPAVLLEAALRKNRAYEKLTCYLTKYNPEEGDSLLGYPMMLENDKFGKMQIFPILEVLSYDGYMLQIMGQGQQGPHLGYNSDSDDDDHRVLLKTASGCHYNFWFPLYTNAAMYQKFKQHVLNAFSVLKFGTIGKKEFDFQQQQIVQVFPCLMNKMIVALQNGNLHQSINSIEAYGHFVRLFLRLLEEFPEIQKYIDEKVSVFLSDPKTRNKKTLGDMGEFIILLAFSKYTLQNREVWKAAMVETVSRMFYWVIDKMDNGTRVFSKKEYGEFFGSMNEKQSTQFFEAGKITNHLLIFNYTASQQFLTNRSEFIKKIDENYGVLEEKEVQEFLQKIHKLKEEIKTYKSLLEFLGLGDFCKTHQGVQNLFRVAWKNAEEQRYIRLPAKPDKRGDQTCNKFN